MAPRKKKAAQARNADSAPAAQPRRSQASQSQAHSQEPKPKSGSKTKPKKANASASSAAKTQKHHPLTASSDSATKAGVKVNKVTNGTDNHSQSSHKKSKPNMARRRKTPAAPLAPKTNAQLELPEGYTRRPQKDVKNGPKQQRPKDTGNQTATTSKAVLPWNLDPKFPKPVKKDCTFNYEREVWRSEAGKDLEKAMLKQLDFSVKMQLRRPSLEWTPEELKQLHDQYWKAGKIDLYSARLAGMKNQASPKLFVTSSMVDPSKIQPVNDNTGLIAVLQVPELRRIILEHLSPSIGDMTALAATCKRAAACVRQSFELWDFTTSNYSVDEFIERRDEKGRLVQGGGVRTDILVVSPALDWEKCEVPYRADFENLIMLCGAITDIPTTFRSVVLDQIPFLDVALFELMVNSMPNLETVTITRCIMLDVTKLKPLLDIIKRHPRRVAGSKDKTGDTNGTTISKNANHQWAGPAEPKKETAAAKKPATRYIKLDFFPFFFDGPTSFKRLGSFGVTHNEPTFNTPKAVFALILQCWDLAKEVGMDLVSDSSSFWSFVRRLPGPDALWSMKAREALITRDYELGLVTTAAGQRLGGRKGILERFADDLTAALTGDNQPHPKIPDGMARYMPEEYKLVGQYWRDTVQCRMCDIRYPRSLFPLRVGTCWACKMNLFRTEMEDSHLRLWQESAIRQWVAGLEIDKATLTDLLSPSRQQNLDKALFEAQCTDWVRDYFMTLKSKDVKVQEVSQPSKDADLLKSKNTKVQETPQPSKQANLPKPKANAWKAVQPSNSKKGSNLTNPQNKPVATSSYASAVSRGLPAQPSAPKPSLPRADGWPTSPEPFVPDPGVADWDDFQKTDENLFSPPPPKTLEPARASLARWRWHHTQATSFDYRNGGPQREDPCKLPLSASDWTDHENGGAENKEHFDLRWEWNSASDRYFFLCRGREEPQNYRELIIQGVLNNARRNENMRKMVRDAERKDQNKFDNDIYRMHHTRVEDCLYSMGTPEQKPFNLDKPLPDPYLNAEEFQALQEKRMWASSKYNHTRTGW